MQGASDLYAVEHGDNDGADAMGKRRWSNANGNNSVFNVSKTT
jgi:hypothetical protein